jgi:HNH endonuclease
MADSNPTAFLSARAFGRLVGASHTAITNAIRRGRLRLEPNGKINPELSIQLWRRPVPGRGPGRQLTCCSCNIRKDRGEFPDRKGRLCAECAHQKREKESAAAALLLSGRKICSGCHVAKPSAEFWGSYCKVCHADRYGRGSGYVSPSRLREQIEAHVEARARSNYPRICERCGFIGPVRDWPRNNPQHPGCFCRACVSGLAAERARRASVVSEGRKICSTCREIKELTEFDHVHGGRHNDCRECRKARRENRAVRAGRQFVSQDERFQRAEERAKAERERKEAIREAELAYKWWLTEGKGAKVHSEWEVMRAERYRARSIERARKKYADDPEGERLRAIRYKHAHPDKVAKWKGTRGRLAAQQSDGTLTAASVGRLFAAARTCPYCGCKYNAKAKSFASKSLDHLDPLSRGGVHGISNVAICCRRCNIRKNRHSFEEWIAMLPENNKQIARRLYAATRSNG